MNASRANHDTLTASSNTMDSTQSNIGYLECSYVTASRCPMELQLHQEQDMQDQAHRLITEVTSAFDRHLSDRELVDRNYWKSVGSNHGLTGYRWRRSMDPQDMPTLSISASSKKTPQLLVTGRIEGTVEDVLYGLSASTAPLMKLNAEYGQHSLADAEVLKVIQPPTSSHPFRFFGIKRFTEHVSYVKGNSRKLREVVYLESIGMATLASGKRVGYRVMHSVDIHGMRPPPNAMRDKVSVCQIFYQSTPSTVKVYMRSHLMPSRSKRLLSIKSLSTLGVEYLFECMAGYLASTHAKKLSAYLYHVNQKRRTERCLRNTNPMNWSIMSISVPSIDEDAANRSGSRKMAIAKDPCDICQRHGSGIRRTNVSCIACSKRVCVKCGVDKVLAYHSSNDQGSVPAMYVEPSEKHGKQDIYSRKVIFCLPCIMNANAQDTAVAARGEVLNLQTQSSSPAVPPRANLGFSTPMLQAKLSGFNSPASTPVLQLSRNSSADWNRVEVPRERASTKPQRNTIEVEDFHLPASTRPKATSSANTSLGIHSRRDRDSSAWQQRWNCSSECRLKSDSRESQQSLQARAKALSRASTASTTSSVNVVLYDSTAEC